MQGKIKGRTLINLKKHLMKFNSKDFKEITSILRVISNHASKKILEIYNSSFDIKKNLIILQLLRQI